jgi:hypothetical protein
MRSAGGQISFYALIKRYMIRYESLKGVGIRKIQQYKNFYDFIKDFSNRMMYHIIMAAIKGQIYRHSSLKVLVLHDYPYETRTRNYAVEDNIIKRRFKQYSIFAIVNTKPAKVVKIFVDGKTQKIIDDNVIENKVRYITNIWKRKR